MKHRLLAIASVFLLLVTVMGGSVSAAPKTSAKAPVVASSPAPVIRTGSDKLMTQLADRLGTASSSASHDVIVQFTQAPSDALYRVMEKAIGSISYKAQWMTALSGFSATLTTAQIRALQALPFVKQIDLDLPVHATLDTSTLYTGAKQARTDFGVNGSRGFACCSNNNVVAAIIDTGIDASHVDLSGTVIGWVDEVAGKTSPYDDNGHGSHVAGIVAGQGVANPAYTGNAPGAALVGIKVLDANGSGSTTNIINGINWMISNKATYNIKVANMSLGATGCSDGTDSLSQAVNNAVNNGIVMVVAAGNSGPATCTISTPAAAANAITVGASADPGLRSTKAGWYLANFSSRGPTLDGRIKPDIVAPGVNIISVSANSTNQYIAHSGTSMATPEITGIVALMFAANYGLTTSQVKSMVTGNATDWGPAGSDSDYGAGLIKAYYAIKQAGGYGFGSFSDGTTHGHAAGTLSSTGAANNYTISVTSTSRPIGLTMIMQGCSCDFDLYLYDPSGVQVASSTGTNRQEQIGYLPTVTGTYTIQVYSYSGSGNYDLDPSWS